MEFDIDFIWKSLLYNNKPDHERSLSALTSVGVEYVFDTLKFFEQNLIQLSMGGLKQEIMYQHLFRKPPNGAHRALSDVKALTEIISHPQIHELFHKSRGKNDNFLMTLKQLWNASWFLKKLKKGMAKTDFQGKQQKRI
eukprot:TRINITY_DN2979_c0_g1_i1.p1 TRINITY_DN2979_c0_g1~~TRINITY_DN2979_c0_g1_i1.p1  ORF type:complete len:139 (-),score=18.44 TRINITY_DN2979_c0_g1_i1:249-665(-)